MATTGDPSLARAGVSGTAPECSTEVPGTLVLHLPSDIGAIEDAVERAVEFCAPAVEDRNRLLFNLRVGLTEAISNAVLFGSVDDPRKKRVRVELRIRPGQVRARVSDEGGGFDPAAVPDPRRPENIAKASGRGIFLMRALMDDVRYNDAGNAVTLVLRGAPGPASPTPSVFPDEADARPASTQPATPAAPHHTREERALDAVSREMQLAHDLQMKLLPPIPRVRGVEAAARVVPAESVGGDFYQVLQLPGGRTGVMIGDVSGHGFPAALIMALVMSAAAISAQQGGAPATVLEHLDRAIGDELESTEMYLSLCYCVLSPGAPEVVYANAGHPHAFIVEPEGTARRLRATDPPMGIGGAPFRESRAKWAPGDDLLLLFTDGLSDTVARRGRKSGEDLVLKTVARSHRESAVEILDRLFEMSAQSVPLIPADDRTAVVVRAE
ncbi:MAG: SpoIIE family protein phosphatase [Gemmatimonadetes bacterium]|nr:SpoIIE family protein phosphatase [Gemmatimonadota bacterium]MYB97318.1 SpoIIE family protein phosphatase [Gemmatimonadota bacterium]